MAEDSPQSDPEDEAHQEIVDQFVHGQNAAGSETDAEVHNPLEDLGYHHLEGIGRSQGMIFDEQDI